MSHTEPDDYLLAGLEGPDSVSAHAKTAAPSTFAGVIAPIWTVEQDGDGSVLTRPEDPFGPLREVVEQHKDQEQALEQELTERAGDLVELLDQLEEPVCGAVRKHADLRLGKRDQQVIDAFTDRRAMDGLKLSTDGVRISGHWMGGTGIAEWKEGKIHFNDLGSRSVQTVQNAIRRNAAPADLADYGGPKQAALDADLEPVLAPIRQEVGRLGQEVARLEAERDELRHALEQEATETVTLIDRFRGRLGAKEPKPVYQFQYRFDVDGPRQGEEVTTPHGPGKVTKVVGPREVHVTLDDGEEQVYAANRLTRREPKAASKALSLWRYVPLAPRWEHLRNVTPETQEQWLSYFQKDQPDEIFVIAAGKPTSAQSKAAEEQYRAMWTFDSKGNRYRKEAAFAAKRAGLTKIVEREWHYDGKGDDLSFEDGDLSPGEAAAITASPEGLV